MDNKYDVSYVLAQYEAILDINIQIEVLLKNADIEEWPIEKMDFLLQEKQRMIDIINECKSQGIAPLLGDATVKLMLLIKEKDLQNQEMLHKFKQDSALKMGNLKRNNRAVKAYSSTSQDDEAAFFMDKKS